MSDSDFEFIDASQVVSTQRQRKPKYKHRLWEDTSDFGMFRYYSALQSLERRRNKTSETKYDHYIDPRMEYVQWWIDNTMPDMTMVVTYKTEKIISVCCDCCGFEVNEKDCVEFENFTVCEDCNDIGLFVCESCQSIYYDFNMSSRVENVCDNCADEEF